MIFLDANFLINLYVETNKYHKRAEKIYYSIEDEELLISKLVIMEVITVLNLRLKKDLKLISNVYNDLNNDYKVIIDNNFYDKGFEILIREHKENNERIPLLDCVYMAIMKELGIKKIATFDKHFDNKEAIVRIH